jgi:hypothetical protein
VLRGKRRVVYRRIWWLLDPLGIIGDRRSKSGTRIEVIDSNEALDCIVASYLQRGELAFATLEQEFLRGVLGVTFRLQAPHPWELPFVSVIDARGDRGRRAYFTKWHEIGHLLILADRGRSAFRRTHLQGGDDAWEEALVDTIAGRCGFHPKIVAPYAEGEISFEKIRRIHNHLCPEASAQAARIGLVDAWPAPCLLLECGFATRRAGDASAPALRAIHVRANRAAERTGLRIPRNMCVPRHSVIQRVICRRRRSADAIEDLKSWQSEGVSLCARKVRMQVVSRQGAADVLVTPLTLT